MNKKTLKHLMHVIRYNLWYFPIVNADRMNSDIVKAAYNDNLITFDQLLYLFDYSISLCEAKKHKISILLFNALIEQAFLHNNIKAIF